MTRTRHAASRSLTSWVVVQPAGAAGGQAEPAVRVLGTRPTRSVVIGRGPLADALAVRLQAGGGVLHVTRPGAVTPEQVAHDAGAATVVHRVGPAGPSPHPARHDLALATAGLLRARLVLAQDLDAIGPPDGRPYTEDRPCEPDTPAGRAAQALSDAALALRRHGRLDAVVVRVPPLYGHGVGAESDLGMPAVRAVAAGRRVRPRRDPDVMRAYAYLPDAVDTLVAAGQHADLARTTLITPVDPALRTTRDLLRMVAVHAGAPPPRLVRPWRVRRHASDTNGPVCRHRHRCDDVDAVDVDSATTEQVLGLAPTRYDVALPGLVADLTAQGTVRSADRRLAPPDPIR